MITCPKCGTQLADGTTFCTNCGSPLAPAQPAPDASQAAPNPAPNPAPQMQPQGAYNQQPQGYAQPPYQQQQYTYVDPSDHTSEFDASDIAENKIFAVTAYLFGFLGIIVALLIKDSPYLKFHVKQSLRLSIAEVLAVIPAIIPVIGWIATGVIEIILIVVEIIAIVWAFQGKSKDLPIIKGIGFLK